MLVIVGLPLTILSTRNHLFLLQNTLNKARIVRGFLLFLSWLLHPPGIISLLPMAPSSCFFPGLPLTIPSIRIHLYFLQHVFNRVCWVLLASFWLFHPTGIISVSSMRPSTKRGNWCPCDYPSTRNHLTRLYGAFKTTTITDYSTHQEHFLSPPWHVKQGQDDFGKCLVSSELSIPKKSLLDFTLILPFPPSSRQSFSLSITVLY